MNNNVNENLGNNKEEPNINLSERETIGSEVPLGEPVSTPRKRKTFGFGKSKAKAKTKPKVKQPDAKKANAKSAKKGKKSSKSATALKIILVILLLSVIALGAVWFFMSKSETKSGEEAPVVIDTSSSTIKPQEQPQGMPAIENQPNQPVPTTGTTPEMKPLADGQQPQVDANKTDGNNIATVDQVNTPLPTADTASTPVKGTDNKATVAEVSKPKPSTKPLTINNMPDPEKIINAEVPKDESLVKEELDKLADEEQRLEQQEKLLDKRLKMMDELTTKKQEQIELLEKQIAQLEEAGK